MTTRQHIAHRILITSLSSALALAITACGGSDDNEGPGPVDSGTTIDSSITAEEASTTPPTGETCEEKVYSELGDACKTCTCGVDPMVAPSCQKPCWDFLACAFAARAGKCAQFAAGGASTKPQLDECVGTTCAVQLSVPGSMVASAYTGIVAACAQPMGSTPGACTPDIGKFAAALPK